VDAYKHCRHILDAAIALAAQIPAASMGGAIEVRPLVER